MNAFEYFPSPGPVQMFDADDWSLETSEAEACEVAPAAAPAAPLVTPRLTALLAAVELCLHAGEALEGKFPSHPKPGPDWWAELRRQVDAVYPQLVAQIEAEGRKP